MLGRLVGRDVARGVRPAELWSAELRELCRSLDLVVVNLECCLSERGARTHAIPGKPFFFRGPPEAVGALTAIGAGVASLANNHALDFGPDAAADTAALLGNHGVVAIGAGADRERARRPALVPAGSVRVGVLAVTDHPAEYAAGDPGWGTAYADLRSGAPGWLLDDVAALRRRCDAAIAFVHWGPNMTSEPAGWQHAVARELQEAGADLVAGHSAHVFHGIGRGVGGPVVFDLGGALDDYAVDAALRNDLGLLAIWQPGGEPELELAGLRIDHGRTRLAAASDAEWVRDRLRAASGALGTSIEPVPGGRLRLAG
jgi:poly-gamma-glutamate synthesis protein (capsule biosynthesis protein)